MLIQSISHHFFSNQFFNNFQLNELEMNGSFFFVCLILNAEWLNRFFFSPQKFYFSSATYRVDNEIFHSLSRITLSNRKIVGIEIE